MHFLIVEDDPAIARHIGSRLRHRGHQTSLANRGSEALRTLNHQTPDAIVLDRLLPDISGLAVIDQLRERNVRIPILMLSALGSVKDRVEGLRAGADDYLSKPFSDDELEARLDAIVRRNQPASDGTELRVGQLRLHPCTHRAQFRDASIGLNRKQFSLLAHLMGEADRLVTRTMLLERVWGYSFSPSTNIVESNISRLRSTLQSVGCDPIETRRGSGYILRSEYCA